VDVVRYLACEGGCSTACQKKNCDTPLHVIVKYLVSEHGCSILCQNKQGDTPLHDTFRWSKQTLCKFYYPLGEQIHGVRTLTMKHYCYAIAKLFANFTEAAIKIFVLAIQLLVRVFW